jgi:hypothetical protein
MLLQAAIASLVLISVARWMFSTPLLACLLAGGFFLLVAPWLVRAKWAFLATKWGELPEWLLNISRWARNVLVFALLATAVMQGSRFRHPAVPILVIGGIGLVWAVLQHLLPLVGCTKKVT